MKEIKCLDKGFVRLVDYMGNDSSIVQAARVSYGQGTKTSEEDEKLIRYLMRVKHTSPFEQVELKFHVKAPIFVFRQWHRHRTASINEISGRYTELKDECFLVDIQEIKSQSKNNKQGRAEQLEDNIAQLILLSMEKEQETAFKTYSSYLENNLAKELARVNLPLSTYSEMYWKVNLHNLFHFLKLRMDSHAQKEIRVYAEALYNITKELVPIACKAFEDYSLYAENFSKMELSILKELFKDQTIKEKFLSIPSNLSKREEKELKDKLSI
jgi:thymidylate synthase (FAD)